ncbi:MAG: hypothetical protein PUB34_04380 [Clostridia bacterium]|nr:hypothetical protein [Clostridia bacterium]
MKTTKGCYIFYSPNGGVWGDGTTEPKPSPTENGVMLDGDRFRFPEETKSLRRDGYRLHTSINYFNVPRYYTANGAGEGIDPERICNGFGYDCWPYNSMEITNGGHDENYFAKEALKLADGETVTLYACWDPLVIYHCENEDYRDFVYVTDSNDYTVLGAGDETRYARNKNDKSFDGYEGPTKIPDELNRIAFWRDSDGNEYYPGKTYTVKEPLHLFPVYR